MTPLPPIFEKKESIHAAPWCGRTAPEKILAIRFQAFGDTVITLPYLQALNAIWPSSQIHFLTRDEFSELPRRMRIFTVVHTIGGGRSRTLQYGYALRLVPLLRKEHFDVVIDLQRNAMSRMIRRFLFPKGFSEFDRYSLNSAGDRTKATIDKLGSPPVPESLPRLDLREDPGTLSILNDAGYHGVNNLIVLNPAGNFVTKSWPLDRYLGFANRWIDNVDANAQFLILGTEAIQEKAVYLKEKSGGRILNLAGMTTASEAFAILQKAELVLSEDSGLMHMAWVAGIPVVALFGSTRSAWSRPLGEWSVCLDSSDLECGECLQPDCRFGDVRCLSRYTVEFIVETAKALLDRRRQRGT